jgi:uncharacterized protein YjiS (DUF1127 family)
MNVGSADTSLSITRSPSTRRCDAKTSNDARSRRELVTYSDLSRMHSFPTPLPETDASAPPPKGSIGRQLLASVGSGAARLFNPNSWPRRRPIKTLMAAPWSHWRNEIEIRRTTCALAKFDDSTLRDLGILDRSQIELTVRFCREC